ncbi:MAG: protease modulator HflC [Rhodospirillales bacterium]|nr:protease modulator HflC [Rhodospirillales bacterium]
MNRAKLAVLGVVVVVVGAFASGALFRMHEAAQGIVMQFGDPKRVIQEPGLNFKIPFIQNVVIYDKRILNLDPPSQEMQLADKERIVVDAFARYRITDPLKFFQSVRTEAAFRDVFGRNLNSGVRNELGLHNLTLLLSPERQGIMDKIQERLNVAAKNFGITVVDIRIVRTDLPQEISQNVYDRMRSEREREANKMRAEGEEIKQTITSRADKERTIILAEARKSAQILIGTGDAERNKVLGEAYGRDKGFFEFYRSMEAYREAFDSETTMVLSPTSDFFQYFGSLPGKKDE